MSVSGLKVGFPLEMRAIEQAARLIQKLLDLAFGCRCARGNGPESFLTRIDRHNFDGESRMADPND